MFTLDGNMTFINVDQTYLSKLHEVCSEVYYKSSNYDNKPYIGILINNNGRKYVIPLSSAKEKHKTWKDVEKDCFRIYEIVQKSKVKEGDIWISIDEQKVKQIFSVMDIKKMIPIKEGVYHRVNINPDENDTEKVKKYKDLLNREYIFCLKIIDDVIVKANKLYDKQMATGKISKFCCDFKALEKVADEY